MLNSGNAAAVLELSERVIAMKDPEKYHNLRLNPSPEKMALRGNIKLRGFSSLSTLHKISFSWRGLPVAGSLLVC
jgi:hypothetical protein